MRKHDIINAFGRARFQARYLEICTPTTGMFFNAVDPAAFAVRHRLMYRCPETFEDGLDITFRTTACGSHELVRVLHATLPENTGYDVIFVDPWHGYAASLTDLHGAWWLLRPGGVMIVHDCDPEDASAASPEYRPGTWCGVTWRAFIDFVLAAAPAGHCVVDTDHGCGLVFTCPGTIPAGLPTARPGQPLVFEWNVACQTEAGPYAFFDRHRQALLNLVSPSAFVDRCDFVWPDTVPAATNVIRDRSWPSPMAGWRIGAGMEIIAPDKNGPDGAMLRGPSLPPGEEMDAIWAARPDGMDTIPYGAPYDVIPGETHEAQLRVIPVVCILQLLLLFVTADGRIVHSPRADAVPAAPGDASARRRWRTVTVRAVAPPSARFATILVRMINPGPGPRCPSAFVTDPVLGRAARDSAEVPAG